MGIDPISLLMIAGSGVQAYSSIAGAEASAGNMRAQAAAMEANALQLERSNKVIDYQRQEEATAGALKTQQLSARQKLIAGQQAAALGSGGLAGNLGLGLDLDMSNLNRYYADRYLVELQGWNTDRNLRQQQNDNSSQADIYKSQASSLRSQAGKTARMGWISGLGGLALNIGTLKAQGLLDKGKNATGDKDADKR